MMSKRMVAYSIVVTGLVVGLIFYAGKHDEKHKQLICISQKSVISADQTKDNTELTKLIVTFGEKTACSRNQPVFHTKY